VKSSDHRIDNQLRCFGLEFRVFGDETFASKTTHARRRIVCPVPSGVLALIPMQSDGTAVSWETDSRIAAAWGPIFGAARIKRGIDINNFVAS